MHTRHEADIVSGVTGTAKPQRLSVYLAKASVADPKDVLENPAALKRVVIDAHAETRTDLYIPDPTGKQPKWAAFFDPYVSPASSGKPVRLEPY